MKKILFILTFLSINILIAQSTITKVVDMEFNEAEHLFFQKKYNFAREAFLLYLRKRPLSQNDKLYYYIGSCYFQDKQYEEAIKYYKIAFDLKDDFSYCNNIANSYYQLKNYNEALVWYQRSIERTYSLYKADIISSESSFEKYYETVVTNTKYFGESFLSNNITDENINTSFISGDLFSNEIITNIIIDTINYTNKTISFTDNTLVKFVESSITNVDSKSNETIIPITNIIISTNIISNGVELNVETNVYTLSVAYTKPFYYSAYLNMGHTYLAISDTTNAALSYEIFLKNVSEEYYQKKSLENVIALIRSNDLSTNFLPFTNSSRESILPDGSVVKESVDFDGTYRKETTDTNGNTVLVYQYRDKTFVKEFFGSEGYRVRESKNPNNEKEINTTFADGTKKQEKYLPDGTRSVVSRKEGLLNEYIEYADSTFLNKTIVSNENENTLIIKRLDGSIITKSKTSNENIYYSRTPEGDEVKRVQANDGTITTETSRADGSVFVKTENTNATSSILASYNDGRLISITTDTNGVNTTKITYPDGRTETRIAKDLSNPSYNYQFKVGDGSTVIKSFYADGSSKIDTRKSDGVNFLEEVSADGVITTTIKKADNTIIKREEHVDGTVVTTTTMPNKTIITETQSLDGRVETETKLKDGSVTTSIKDIDGTTTQITQGKNGETIKKIMLPDGTTKNITELLNGATITIENIGTVRTTAVETKDGYKLVIVEEQGFDTKASITKDDSPITKSEAQSLLSQFPDVRININIIDNLLPDVVDSTENGGVDNTTTPNTVNTPNTQTPLQY